MKKRKSSHIEIKTPFWSASIPKNSLWIALAVFAAIVGLLYLVFKILWIAVLSTLVGFIVFGLIMPRPNTPPGASTSVVAKPKPKKPAPGEQKRERSGRR